MPNVLRIDSAGPAAAFYRSLDGPVRAALDTILDYIRDNPQPDGERITSILLSPVVIYYFNDSELKLSYGLSYFPDERQWQIDMLNIGFA